MWNIGSYELVDIEEGGPTIEQCVNCPEHGHFKIYPSCFSLLQVIDKQGRLWVDTRLQGCIQIFEENPTHALILTLPLLGETLCLYVAAIKEACVPSLSES